MVNESDGVPKARFSLRRMLPLLILVAGLGLFFAFDLDAYVNMATLRRHRAELMAWVGAQPALAPLGFTIVYIAAVAFSLPIAVFLSLLSGFLFGLIVGTVVVVVASTVGASLLFLAARTALGEPLRARAGPMVRKLEAGFRANALSYMLFLRLVPAFPFWAVNLVPALLGVPLGTFVLGTGLGVIPGAFVFVYVGRSLGTLLDAGENPTVGSVLTPDIVGALVLLGLLALVPVVYRKFKERQGLRL